MMPENANFIDSIVVPHTEFSKAYNTLDRAIQHSFDRQVPTGLTLTGESGTGKTTLLEYLAEQYPTVRNEHGLIKPILVVTVPSSPTVRELAEMILAALEAPPGLARETEVSKTNRLAVVLKNTGVRAIFLQEVNHFVLRGDKRLVAAADWFKVLMDATNLVFVLSGLASSLELLHQNEQLKRRFSARLELNRFDWKNKDHQKEFIAILDAFHRGIPQFFMPVLTSPELAFRVYIATGGLISNIKVILHKAVDSAIAEKRNTISLQQLGQAWQETVGSDAPAKFNPITQAISADNGVAINEALAFAASVGIVDSTPASKKPRK